MYKSCITLSSFTYRIALLFLGASLLGSCGRAQQLGMEYDPQEILNNKLNEPDTVLNPDQSITLLNYCAKLGERNAASAAGKTVSIFAGNTGVGKSTTLNALLGCQMSTEIDEFEEQRIVVNPESPNKEVLPIGHHGRQSQTLWPKIVQTPDEPNSAYCDCPGFSDTRGAEINIANAINIKKILTQAAGVNVVFLADYTGLRVDRGSSIRNMEDMCGKMFGGAENLKKYQNSVLLGITKAPRYNASGQPFSINSVRLRLNDSNSVVAAILANRAFLFDPLERTTDGSNFWSLEQCRSEIANLPVVPQPSATTLFQTTLTGDDKAYLLTTVRRLQPKIINAIGAITQGDVTALGQHWQLLQRLRVVEHPEVAQIIKDQVLPAINVAILQKADALKSSANAHKFRDAQRQLNELTSIVNQLPGVSLACNIDEMRRHIRDCEADKDDKEALKRHLAALSEEVAKANEKNIFEKLLVAVGGMLGGPVGTLVGYTASKLVENVEEVVAEKVLKEVRKLQN